MIYTISSESLTVEVNDKGAQLWSIRTRDGREYLWQGDPAYWVDRALNLFPQIGLCTNGRYTLHGQEFPMDIHGFVKDTVLTVSAQDSHGLTMSFTDSPATRRFYPYAFAYSIGYRLEGYTLTVTITVENRDSSTMYFSVGGHPGFRLPLDEGLQYDDYYLQFPAGATAKRAMCTPGDCIMTGEVVDYPLEDGRIPLSHQLFAERVLILKDMPHTVTLRSRTGSRQVTVRYPDMRYLGIWKALGTDAPYVCLEPWSGVSARKGVVEEYSTHPDMIHLQPGCVYQNTWYIDIKE